MIKHQVLYLPSTPLNILVSIAHAQAFRRHQTSTLIIIDQKNMTDNPYIKALQHWPRSPFTEVDILPGDAVGTAAKKDQRKTNFVRLDNLAKVTHFDAVAVGSDRRVEFQFMMHQCRKQARLKGKKPTEGWYLDDGLYSYAGRPFHWFKDGVNSLIKKLTYGLWWQEPKTVGASDWIDTIWLFDQCKANLLLKKKHTEQIDPKWFKHRRVKEYSQHVFTHLGIEDGFVEALGEVDLLLLLPHPHNYSKISGFEDRLEQVKREVSRKSLRLAVKYHPRTQERDRFCFEEDSSAMLVPSDLAFELLVSQLNLRTKLLGDVGTTLLTAKWLRPDIQSVALLSEQGRFEQRMAAIMRQHGVDVKSHLSAAMSLLNFAK